MSNRNVSNGNTIHLDGDSNYDGGTSSTIHLGGGSTSSTIHLGGNTRATELVEGVGAATSACGGETQLWDDTEAPRRRCVGWLLVVSGPSCGCSRELYSGRNIIGRESEVQIDGDSGVSRCQCVLTYDPRYNEYVLGVASGHAITRVNGKRVDTSVGLNRGDIIELSEKTQVRFIPACDELFVWS